MQAIMQSDIEAMKTAVQAMTVARGAVSKGLRNNAANIGLKLGRSS